MFWSAAVQENLSTLRCLASCGKRVVQPVLQWFLQVPCVSFVRSSDERVG